MKVKNPENVLPGAEAFFLEGSKYGIMCIHGGGGGSAADMREITQYLHEQTGFSVYVPLLPGFGTVKEDLADVQIEDWLDALKNDFTKLKKEMEKVFLLGHSMGGVLALYLAGEFSEEVSGIIAISAPVKLKGILIKVVPVFKHIIKYWRQNDIEEWKRVTNGVWAGYEYIPLSVVGKFQKLIKQNRQRLHLITSPILINQGTRDEFVTKKSATQIYEQVSSSDKNVQWWDSDHAILFSHIKVELFESITEWLNLHTSP